MLKDNVLIINLIIIINVSLSFLTFNLFFKFYIRELFRYIIKFKTFNKIKLARF